MGVQWRRRWADQGFSLADAERPGRSSCFPDWVQALVVAIACTCELLAQRGLALSRHFASSIRQVVTEREVQISLRTVQRMLAQDHQGTPRSPLRGDPKPWRYRSWIHSRDPRFLEKARDDPRPLPGFLGGSAAGPQGPGDLGRREDLDPGPLAPGGAARPWSARTGRADDQRRGALQYLAAWDVRRGIPRGRCERITGIAAFDRLVAQVMSREPYRSAPRGF